jgi:hypothetical protein
LVRGARVVLPFLALVGTLTAFEAGTRALGVRFPSIPEVAEGDRGLWTYDATKGWFHRPASEGASFLGGPDGGRIRINALGLRGGEVSRAKPEGVKRVLVLGDSFVFGVGVDESHLFTTYLAALLNRAAPDRFEVLNLGISGYSTDQEYLLLEELGRPLMPDLVILVACDNDFSGNVADFAYLQYYKPYFELGPAGELRRRNLPVPRLDRAQRLRLWLAQRSNLWNLMRSRRSSQPVVRQALELFQVGVAGPARVDAVRLTAALVTGIRDLAGSAGAAFALLNTGHRGEDTGAFHALRPLLREAGVPFLGLEATLAEARRSRPQGRWDFGYDPHWNVDSHRLAAEVAHAFLRERKLVD